MKREIVVACDVDGVINALGDENFSRADMCEKMLLHEDGKPRALLTFSPSVIQELNTLAQRIPFFMLTSWNERVNGLIQVGLCNLPFLMVDRANEASERDSKMEHIVALAKTNTVIWIDDFAKDWFDSLPADTREHVHPIQPNHHQGLETHDMQEINTLLKQSLMEYIPA